VTFYEKVCAVKKAVFGDL